MELSTELAGVTISVLDDELEDGEELLEEDEQEGLFGFAGGGLTACSCDVVNHPKQSLRFDDEEILEQLTHAEA